MERRALLSTVDVVIDAIDAIDSRSRDKPFDRTTVRGVGALHAARTRFTSTAHSSSCVRRIPLSHDDRPTIAACIPSVPMTPRSVRSSSDCASRRRVRVSDARVVLSRDRHRTIADAFTRGGDAADGRRHCYERVARLRATNDDFASPG
jgi:hypothetical protein